MAMMARAADAAVPVVTGDRPGADQPMGQWPAALFVAIESVDWGGAVWDAPDLLWDDPSLAWDETGGEPTAAYTDAICWLQGIDIDHGQPDTEGRFRASEAAFTLDNHDGRWSRYGPSGQLIFYPPGRRVLVWAELDGEPWWLFAGRIATWVEDPAGRVEVTAVDAFSELNVRLNAWEAGAEGDTPLARLFAIAVDVAGFDPDAIRMDTGAVSLLAHPTSASPLEELQHVAESDGGVIFIDADGALVYLDRTWVNGRADQSEVPVLSGNICDAPVVVWDLELSTDDDTLVNEVHLANLDVPPVEVEAVDAVSRARFGRFTPPQNRDQELWVTEAEGQDLADYLVARRGDPTARISSASLYLHDPRFDYWRVAIDRRRGDVLELQQDVLTADGTTYRIATLLVLIGIRHQISPAGWITTIATSRVVGNRLVTRWDESAWTWDDPSDGNTWS